MLMLKPGDASTSGALSSSSMMMMVPPESHTLLMPAGEMSASKIYEEPMLSATGTLSADHLLAASGIYHEPYRLVLQSSATFGNANRQRNSSLGR